MIGVVRILLAAILQVGVISRNRGECAVAAVERVDGWMGGCVWVRAGQVPPSSSSSSSLSSLLLLCVSFSYHLGRGEAGEEE